MTTGQKIKLTRLFRNMTMKELGIKSGLPEGSADSRMGQYESDIRIPKNNLLIKISEVLNISKYALLPKCDISPINIMEELFWLEENINSISNKQEAKRTRFVHSHMLSTGIINIKHLVPEFKEQWKNQPSTLGDILDYSLSEYKDIQTHFLENRITLATYLEWKFQWPMTENLLDFLCDHEPDVFTKIDDNAYKIKSSFSSNEIQHIYENPYLNLCEYFAIANK